MDYTTGMASDRAQYNRALKKWDELHDAGAYSVDNAKGKVAILCSGYEMGEDSVGFLRRGTEREAFRRDGTDIAKELGYRGIEAFVFLDFTLDDAANVLSDKNFSCVMTIGNGNLSSAYDSLGQDFDWRFIAENSTHLKTGRFVQRHCGHAILTMSVPLGTFAMTSHADVWAAYGTTLSTELTEEDTNSIEQLHPHRRLDYRVLKSMFPGLPPYKDESLEDQPS